MFFVFHGYNQVVILAVLRGPVKHIQQPKSTACICDICENKMTGGKTACFAPTWIAM
jgi:hypothetical protein